MNIEDLTNEQIRSFTPEQLEQIDENPELLDEILAGQKKAAENDDKPKQTEQDGVTNDAGEDEPEAKDDEEKKDEEEEPILLNKSGKGAIPYSTLKGVRVENATLKEQLEATQAKLQEMEKIQALLKEKEDAKGNEKLTEEVDTAIDSHLEVLKQDYPELHQVMTAVLDGSKREAAKLQQKADKLEIALEELNREKAEAKRAAEKSVEEQVAEATDNNPDLSLWRDNDREAFNEAVRQDEVVRTTAKWAKASYAERFEEVVRRVRAIMPEAAVPNKPNDTEKVKATAKAKLEAAPEKKLKTLSDIPSGADPTTEKDSIENLTPGQLTSRLMKMPEHAAAAMRAGLD